MKRWYKVLIGAYIVFTLPSCFTGMSSLSWCILCSDSAEHTGEQIRHTVGTVPPRYAVIPTVAPEDYYRIDARDQSGAITTLWNIYGRGMQVRMYEVIWPHNGSDYVTVVLHDKQSDDASIVVQITNVMLAQEIPPDDRLAMR